MRQQFEPSWMGIFVNPFFFARRGLWRELPPLLAQLFGDVLDVGCGRKPYRRAVSASRYVGVDVDIPANRALGAADVYYDGKALPFPSASFDAALCSQVLEHVFEPDKFVAEIRRVLKADGRLLLTVPFAWDEHEQPFDYARYSSFGIRSLLERNGFEVLVLKKVTRGPRALAQLASGWMFKITRTDNTWLMLSAQLLLVAPMNIVGAIITAVLPAGEDFYLDNIVLARVSVTPKT